METTQAVAALAALAQETRLDVYRLLVQAGESGLSVGEIGEAVGVAPATLSFHLKELVHAGLIAPRQVGRYIFYSARYAQMTALLGFLTENCCADDGTACCVPAAAQRGTSNKPRKRVLGSA
ncbi:MAG: helix-turn-helix transcriptional regulator [Betaproteobacteria bacterium]|nr:helix-turn-helix transcriptional regulator [Betaproteobacteria bacterium]